VEEPSSQKNPLLSQSLPACVSTIVENWWDQPVESFLRGMDIYGDTMVEDDILREIWLKLQDEETNFTWSGLSSLEDSELMQLWQNCLPTVQ
jgi:hypothetical protein